MLSIGNLGKTPEKVIPSFKLNKKHTKRTRSFSATQNIWMERIEMSQIAQNVIKLSKTTTKILWTDMGQIGKDKLFHIIINFWKHYS